MKVVVVGDAHIGSSFNLGKLDADTQLNFRLLDFYKTCNNIIENAHKNGVKAVIFTGDVFSNRKPGPSHMDIFSRCLQKITKYGMQAVILIGNHDQQRTSSTTTVDVYKSLGLSNIFVYPDMAVHKIEDTNFIMMPFRDRKMVGGNSNQEAIDKLKNQLDDLTKDLTGKKVVIGHFMTGKPVHVSDIGCDDENFSISELVLPFSMFEKMDLVVMGHVHQHEILKEKNPLIMYIGSMDKVSFGERLHNKVSIILDTKNITHPEIVPTKVRNLYEISLDYSVGDKYYKNQMNEQIISDIEKFNNKNNLKDSVVKVIIKVKESDLYHISQDKIKEFILSKKVQYMTSMQISSVSTRKLRNKEISEKITEKKAIESYINGLKEPDSLKKRLLKTANSVIEEVEGK